MKDRSIKGAYATLVRDLELGDTVGFREYTRMDLRTFWEIVKFDRSRNKQKRNISKEIYYLIAVD